MKKIKVGKYEPKEVTELNHELFLMAQKIMEDACDKDHLHHYGDHGLGIFIDWLEENYTITKNTT